MSRPDCDYCGGTGWITTESHGRIPCPDCNPLGKGPLTRGEVTFAVCLWSAAVILSLLPTAGMVTR